MEQSKKHSAVESATNIIVGIVGSLIIWRVFAPIVGIPYKGGQSIQIVGVYTVWSFIRSYVIRRLFNYASRAPNEPQRLDWNTKQEQERARRSEEKEMSK